jgi:hypothetical protein
MQYQILLLTSQQQMLAWVVHLTMVQQLLHLIHQALEELQHLTQQPHHLADLLQLDHQHL